MTKLALNYLLELAKAELQRRRAEYADAMKDYDIVHETQVVAEKRLAEVNRAIGEVGEALENRA